MKSQGWPAAASYAVSASAAADTAGPSLPVYFVPVIVPGGKPTIAVPGETPMSPVTTVGPVFVIVVAATAAKPAALPSGGVTAAAWAEETTTAESSAAVPAAERVRAQAGAPAGPGMVRAHDAWVLPCERLRTVPEQGRSERLSSSTAYGGRLGEAVP